MTAAGADGYLVWAGPRVNAMRDAFAVLALRHCLPGVGQIRCHADAGVLLSYRASLSAIHRREAYFSPSQHRDAGRTTPTRRLAIQW